LPHDYFQDAGQLISSSRPFRPAFLATEAEAEAEAKPKSNTKKHKLAKPKPK